MHENALENCIENHDYIGLNQALERGFGPTLLPSPY